MPISTGIDLNVQPAALVENTPAAGFAEDSAEGYRTIELSIVIPTYRAEDCLHALHSRLTATLEKLGASYEIIFMEDCSPDNSWQLLKGIAEKDSRVWAMKLSRNFGQQLAITAGLSKARGKWIVVMDCDLQDPPECISDLYMKALTGYDIVFAKRKNRTHSKFRLFSNKLYFSCVNFFSGSNITGEYGAFSIISSHVRDAYLKFSDRNRHYLMILFWLGFDCSDIEYEQAERFAGESSYSLRSLIKLAVQGMLFQTTILLKMIVCLGFCISFGGLGVAAWAIVGYIQHGALPGWTSLAVSTLLLGGAILTCQGIVGLYVGEVFDQVKQRPLFVIARDSHQKNSS